MRRPDLEAGVLEGTIEKIRFAAPTNIPRVHIRLDGGRSVFGSADDPQRLLPLRALRPGDSVRIGVLTDASGGHLFAWMLSAVRAGPWGAPPHIPPAYDRDERRRRWRELAVSTPLMAAIACLAFYLDYDRFAKVLLMVGLAVVFIILSTVWAWAVAGLYFSRKARSALRQSEMHYTALAPAVLDSTPARRPAAPPRPRSGKPSKRRTRYGK